MFTAFGLRKVITGLVAGLASLITGSLIAQTDESSEDDSSRSGKMIEEIVTIGTRIDDRLALYSPVPVDVLDTRELIETGQTEVGRMIQSLAPSFNFSSSSISDGTDALRPATLRGLGPDQLLVLVNGKRRHGSALLHINSSVGRGTSGTDLNAIPQIAISRIEILRDGASAQYGSDAVAGAINLVLANSPEANRLSLHYGEYSEGDGENIAISFLRSGSIGEEGLWNLALEYRDRDYTNRAGPTGVCQYSCTRMTNAAGESVQVTADPREINFNRINFRVGDAASEQFSGALNIDLPLNEKVNFYLFTTFSQRDNTSAGFYRRANQSSRNPSLRSDGLPVNNGEAYITDGFLPMIETDITDYSVDFGFDGQVGDSAWKWDASLGYGFNEFSFGVANSLNASLVASSGASPRKADSGGLSLSLITAEVSFRKPLSWGHAAFGAAFRQDRFEQEAGELLSYNDYDGPGGASGGIQVFPGYRPRNEIDKDRQSFAGYADIEWNVSNKLNLGGALRYEHYSDFGDTFNVKGTLLLDLAEAISLRAAVSTGFRAPSLSQLYFSSVSTQFIAQGGVATAFEVGLFRNNDTLVQQLGIPELSEESSLNYSAGIILRPLPSLAITIDYYRVDVEDRIVVSNQIRPGNDPFLDAALAAAGANRGQFFLNAADTETSGIDLMGEYTFGFFGGGELTLTFGANFTETEISSLKPPASLSSVANIQTLLFTRRDQSIVEEWQPESRINLGAAYARENFNASVNVRRYGSYAVTQSSGFRQKYSAKNTVDLRVSFSPAKRLTLTLGGNNVTDELPDRNQVETRGGTIVDGSGNLVVDSTGVFPYPRAAAPFGFNGAYWYFGVNWSL